MLNFVLRRTFYCLLIVAGVVMLTFALFNIGAGDPAAAVLGKNAGPDEIDALRRELGADLPLFYGRECRSEAFAAFTAAPGHLRRQVELHRNFASGPLRARIKFADGGQEVREVPPETAVFRAGTPGGPAIAEVSFFRLQENPFNSQFLRSLGEIVSFRSTFPYVEFFNFGNTISTREPVKEILKRGIGPSCLLMFPIFFGEMFCGIALALIAVAFRNRWPDRLLVLAAVAGMSISYLVVIIFAQWLLGYYLEWFPVWGFDGSASLGLPVTVGIICGIGGNLRFYRTVFSDELGREYLRTAIAKGASPFRVYGRHLLRNAAVQIITRTSATLPFLFTGSLLLESFFGIPGLGFTGIDALYNSDIQLLKALVVLSALLFVAVNLLADLAYAWADPRIRME